MIFQNILSVSSDQWFQPPHFLGLRTLLLMGNSIDVRSPLSGRSIPIQSNPIHFIGLIPSNPIGFIQSVQTTQFGSIDSNLIDSNPIHVYRSQINNAMSVRSIRWSLLSISSPDRFHQLDFIQILLSLLISSDWWYNFDRFNLSISSDQCFHLINACIQSMLPIYPIFPIDTNFLIWPMVPSYRYPKQSIQSIRYNWSF